MIRAITSNSEIHEIFRLDDLNQNSVSVKRQSFLCQGDERSPVGEPHRRAYTNSKIGREMLKEDGIDDNFINAILAIWGEIPTVEDYDHSEEVEIDAEVEAEADAD